MVRHSVTDRLIRPPAQPTTRILLLARHAPLAPDFACRDFPGDGGYPVYYHRVWRVLGDLGYPVTTADDCAALTARAGGTDLVFSLYNRMSMRNPEIFITATCQYLGLPVVGGPANIRAVAEDKWLCKQVARSLGLPVADGAIYGHPDALARPPAFPGPYFVKNRFGAASEGVGPGSIQDDWSGAAEVARRLMARGMAVLVEAFVPGIDITVPVLGGETPLALGVVRPLSDQAGGIITEDLKRDDPLGYEMFATPADLDQAMADDVARLWGGLGPMDYLRLDYRFDPATGRRVFLEFNICCHIGRSGAICLAAGQWGLTQADVLGHVVEFSRRRNRALAGA